MGEEVHFFFKRIFPVYTGLTFQILFCIGYCRQKKPLPLVFLINFEDSGAICELCLGRYVERRGDHDHLRIL